jgi:hypothetical protein
MMRPGASTCAVHGGLRDGMKGRRECVYGEELDVLTLIWTRGRDFPLGMLETRLKCPRCGSRRVRVAFSIPPTAQPSRALKRWEHSESLRIQSHGETTGHYHGPAIEKERRDLPRYNVSDAPRGVVRGRSKLRRSQGAPRCRGRTSLQFGRCNSRRAGSSL